MCRAKFSAPLPDRGNISSSVNVTNASARVPHLEAIAAQQAEMIKSLATRVEKLQLALRLHNAEIRTPLQQVGECNTSCATVTSKQTCADALEDHAFTCWAWRLFAERTGQILHAVVVVITIQVGL